VVCKREEKAGLHMLPVTNRLGLRIKMKRTAAGLTRKEMSIYLGGKPSPRTIFNVEMGSPHEQMKETLRLVKAFLKSDTQAILLRAKSLGSKPGRKNARRRHR